MAGNDEPEDDRKPLAEAGGVSEGELDRRKRQLEAVLATKVSTEQAALAKRSPSGYGQALKLSSEFIAGIAVGAGIGWGIDKLAGTTPWGLIVFLLLGFGAGVLNVMRSAGMVSEAGVAGTSAKRGDNRET